MRPGPPIARSRRGRLTATLATVAMVVGALVALPAGAQQGGFGDGEATQRANRAKVFLQDVQNPDGGLPTARGRDSDPAVSAWAALALASAKVSPRDQVRRGGGTSLWEYLQEAGDELRSTDDLARLALVARAAKSSPDEVGDVTPIATIVSRQAADGGVADSAAGEAGVVSTAWAALALPSGEARTKARRWLTGARNTTDGGWPAAKGGPSDAVATGLALQALRKTVPATPSYRFLRDVQRAGGLARRTGGAPEPLATAVVIQGEIASASATDREQLAITGVDPTTYLWNRQARSGAVGSVLQTAQVLPALARRAYPLAAVSSKGPTNTGAPVEDEDEPEDDEPTTTTTTTSTGPSGTSTAPNAVPGGEGDDDSTGTTATGGGSGAPGDVAGAGAPATTTQAAPPATTTTGPAPPTTPATPSDQVTGSVVGSTEAAPAAATTGGGGGDDEDRSGLVLAGLIVLFIAFGAWLERRPTRLRGVAS